jgi:phage shock protein A
MNLWSQMKLWFKMKTSAVLDKAEDPRQVFDYAYVQQQELLRTVKRGLVEVGTSKYQLEQQIRKRQARIPVLEERAKKAMAAGREDLARISLHRKQTSLGELIALEEQLAEVIDEERRLVATEQEIAIRVDQFRTRREIFSARYTAAEAQVQINEALIGVSSELAELCLALGRVEEKAQQMLARASAIDALLDNGVLDISLGTGDIFEAEFRQLEADNAIEEELKALKAG